MNATIKALQLYQKSLAMNKQFFPANHIEITSVDDKIHLPATNGTTSAQS
jgi:hypothetical protein